MSCTEQRHLVVWERNVFFPHFLEDLMIRYPGDWITISRQHLMNNTLVPEKTRSLLGQEFQHGLFDARSGFNLDAFLILAGTLKKGSILLLLLPENMETCPDDDTLRWNNVISPIATPHFVYHLKHILKKHSIPILRVPHDACLDILMKHIPVPQKPSAIEPSKPVIPTPEQKDILVRLQNSNARIVTLTAKRGRGKSALAGFFTHSHTVWICAPNKKAAKTVLQFAKPSVAIWAPDDLLENLKLGIQPPPWILVDEAAMIPVPILHALIRYAKRILLITTTEGYEGTGQGFLLRLLANIPHVEHYTLTMPIRWLSHDLIENMTSDLLVETIDIDKMSLNSKVDKKKVQIEMLSSSTLIHHEANLKQFYGLLKRAHYKTTPTDLRRLLDAQKINMIAAYVNSNVIGSMMIIQEGELDEELSHAIWCGTRRPPGNLVAQSLTAHAGEVVAATLSSLRINRLAIDLAFRRQGIGQNMIATVIEHAKTHACDFVSVSFAYHPETYAFWVACGFDLVHIGSHREASSGTYAIMVLKPLTAVAKSMRDRLQKRLRRNGYWLRHKINLDFFENAQADFSLNSDDWQELSGFVFASRSYEGAYPALCRLQKKYGDKNDSSLFSSWTDEKEAIKKFGLTGKAEFIAVLRNEIKPILKKYGIIEQPILKSDCF